jgi:hypothetical protein
MFKRIAAVGVGLCLVAACSGSTSSGSPDGGGTGSSGGGSGSGGGGTTVAQAAADRANAYCAKLSTCAPEAIQRDYGSQATCVTRYTAYELSALNAPSTGNTPETSEACTAAYAGWACTDFLDAQNIPAACVQKTGGIATGSACAFSGQCQTGFCAIAPHTLCGVCATVPAAGDSCATQGCGQGLSCTSDTQTCVVLGTTGATCGKGYLCGDDFVCVGANTTTGVTGTCQPAVATAGAACDPENKTGPGCDHAQLLTCNTQSKTCAALTMAAGGQPCGTNVVDDQTAICAAEGTCTGATSTAAGTCTASAADGQACDTANGPACLSLSVCVVTEDGGTAGTCTPEGSVTCQ